MASLLLPPQAVQPSTLRMTDRARLQVDRHSPVSSSQSSPCASVLRLKQRGVCCSDLASSAAALFGGDGRYSLLPVGVPSLKRARGSTAARAAMDLKEEMLEFAAAERRWQSQISDGRVKALTSREAGAECQAADTVVLDVRPSFERRKGWVKGSLWVPAFDVDTSASPPVLAYRVYMFVMGGWWSGARLTKRNERFMVDVMAKIPKSTRIIVACQTGLRSLAACEHLYKCGFRNLCWLQGGFDNTRDEDFEREGPEPLQFGGLGGVSEFVGWTEPQQQLVVSKGGWPHRLVFFGRAMALVVLVDVTFLALTQLGAYMRSIGQ